jgi:hypothetical protein
MQDFSQYFIQWQRSWKREILFSLFFVNL